MGHHSYCIADAFSPFEYTDTIIVIVIGKNFRAVRAHTSPFLTVLAFGFACVRHALLLLRAREDKNKRLATRVWVWVHNVILCTVFGT